MSNQYPIEWPDVAKAIKEAAHWRCVRCGHPHELPKARVLCDQQCDAAKHPGGLNDGRPRVLTVHHMDGDKANLAWWNLLPLCQVCHLSVQGRVILARPWIFEHSDWIQSYMAGWYAWLYMRVQLDRADVENRLDELLCLERDHILSGGNAYTRKADISNDTVKQNH